MKKRILLIPVLLFALAANAQFIEATNYRGAFAPAPAKQWTDNWTNWDPNNTVYPATDTTVTTAITGNVFWSKSRTYKLSGIIYVNSGATLTIEAGTVIRGDETIPNSSLLVAKGGKLYAEGTECNPIVFTSNKPVGQRAPGQWGGVIILGNASHNLGGAYIEGLSQSDPRNFHGAPIATANDADNSGSLKYIRIEFGGYIFSANNEINGLTMGSVGSGTTLDYIQSSFNDDDAFEWFGGTVNAKHLVAYRTKDDDFDTDNGYSGMLQFLLGIKDPAIADVSESNGFESDNTAGNGVNGFTLPKTKAVIYNATMLGGFRCGTPAASVNSLHRRGAHLRRNTDQDIFNSIFMGFRQGLHIDGTLALGNFDEDSLIFSNNVIANDYTTYNTTVASLDATTRTRFQRASYGNDSTNYSTACNLLVNPFPSNYLNPDFRPNLGYVDAVTGLGVSSSKPDLFTAPDLQLGSFNPGNAADLGIFVGEAGFGIATGTIVITVPKVAGLTYGVPGLSLTGTPALGSNSTTNGNANNNGDWKFSDNGSAIIIELKAGAAIPKAGSSYIGLVITRQAGSSAGLATQLINLDYTGDADPSNNTSLISITFN